MFLLSVRKEVPLVSYCRKGISMPESLVDWNRSKVSQLTDQSTYFSIITVIECSNINPFLNPPLSDLSLVDEHA